MVSEHGEDRYGRIAGWIENHAGASANKRLPASSLGRWLTALTTYCGIATILVRDPLHGETILRSRMTVECWTEGIRSAPLQHRTRHCRQQDKQRIRHITKV